MKNGRLLVTKVCVCTQLCLLFGKEGCPHLPLVQSLLAVVVRKTLELPVSEHTDIGEAFMQLCSNLIKKNPSLLIVPEEIDMTDLLAFGNTVLSCNTALLQEYCFAIIWSNLRLLVKIGSE